MDGVVMLVNEFPPLPIGGAEQQAERLASYLARRGWPVWVITRRLNGLPAQETRAGYKVVRPPLFGPGKIRSLTFVLGAIHALWRLRRQYRILHAHLAFGPAFAAVLAGRLLSKRVLIKLGNSGEFGDIHVSQQTLRGRFRLAVFRRWADGVVVLDEVMAGEAQAAGFDPQRLYPMNNGIDARTFAPHHPRSQAQASLGLTGKVVVLYVGRLAVQKSLPTVIKGLANGLPECPALHLLIVGDGPERPELENQVHLLGLGKHVTFAGRQSNVHPYFEAADLFVLPSAAEGISNALLEGMAAGLACLATPVGGSTEVLDHGRCGVLLRAGDAKAWGQELAKLGNDPDLRSQFGAAARQRVLSQYDFSVVGAQYEDLYARLLGRQGPGKPALHQQAGPQ
jgi:glycosyltransferase involved in cell wall biosynthesis